MVRPEVSYEGHKDDVCLTRGRGEDLEVSRSVDHGHVAEDELGDGLHVLFPPSVLKESSFSDNLKVKSINEATRQRMKSAKCAS